MGEDQNSQGEGGLGGPMHSRLSTLCGHPCCHGFTFLGLAEGKSLWGGSGWAWAVVGAGGSTTQGSLGSPEHCFIQQFQSAVLKAKTFTGRKTESRNR